MVLNIKDLEICTYDKNDYEQRHLKYLLDNDEYFRKYVTKKIDERLSEGNFCGEDLCFDTSYFVKYKKEFVGYIRLESLRWDGTLNIECAVSPEYRNQNYGKIIVETISDYILENMDNVKKLRGVIDKSNYASLVVAKKSCFVEECVDSEYDYDYVYVTKTR